MGRRPADNLCRWLVLQCRCARSALAISILLLATTDSAFAADSASPNQNEIGPHILVEAAPSESETLDGALPPIERLPIGPPPRGVDGSSDAAAGSAGPSSTRTIMALGVVIALIFVTRWVMRKAATRVGGMSSQLGPGGRAPSGVLTVLARYPVGRGQSLVMLQMDQRILLLNQTGQGFQTLAEITDPEEVASLLIKTRDEENDSLSTRFTGLLKRFERDPEIVDRNEWPSRNPTTVDAALRLFPNQAATRATSNTDPLAAIRERVAELEGTLA